jgi:hypothetical protein
MGFFRRSSEPMPEYRPGCYPEEYEYTGVETRNRACGQQRQARYPSVKGGQPDQVGWTCLPPGRMQALDDREMRRHLRNTRH